VTPTNGTKIAASSCTADASGASNFMPASSHVIELLQQLLAKLCSRLHGYVNDAERWLGHRVWVIDGSSCSMADTPALQQAFGQPSSRAAGCGFPVAHLMALFHVQTGMLLRIAAAPMRTHDLTQARRMHDAFGAGDVVLADRGFCSYWHLAQLSQAGVHAVFRLHQKQIVSFRKGRMHVPPSPPVSVAARPAGPADNALGAVAWPTRSDRRIPQAINTAALNARGELGSGAEHTSTS
jgi:hypothetical protein